MTSSCCGKRHKTYSPKSLLATFLSFPFVNEWMNEKFIHTFISKNRPKSAETETKWQVQQQNKKIIMGTCTDSYQLIYSYTTSKHLEVAQSYTKYSTKTNAWFSLCFLWKLCTTWYEIIITNFTALPRWNKAFHQQ